MRTKILAVTLSIAAFLAAGVAQAGGPTPAHPCYEVADCKTKTSQPEFSACIKENKAEADAIQACADFRKDKDAWMKANGVSDLKALFGS